MNWRDQSLALQNISQCKTDLDFSPLAHWPSSLPGMAVNTWVVAGFGQTLVLNHSIPESQAEKISELFLSLHPDLSWAEVAELWSRSRHLAWFPLKDIASNYHLQLNAHFVELAEAFLQLPDAFRRLAAQKKWRGQDFAPLLLAGAMNLRPLCDKIVFAGLIQSQSVQAFEWGLELLLMGHSEQDLHLHDDQWRSESWLQHLRGLHLPGAPSQDQAQHDDLQKKLSQFTPQTTLFRWVRHGDQAGLEVKMFLAHPSDLAKQMHSLQQIQEVLEQGPWKKH